MNWHFVVLSLIVIYFRPASILFDWFEKFKPEQALRTLDWKDSLFTRNSTGARYTKSIGSLELRHKELNNDPYSWHNTTIDFTQ